MSAATVDDLVTRIRALPPADRALLARRLDDPSDPVPPARPKTPSEAVAEVCGMFRDRLPPETLGVTNEELREIAQGAWGEREARSRAVRDRWNRRYGPGRT